MGQFGSMATSLAGGMLGAWVGGPIGGMVGSMAGGMIGNLIFNRAKKPLITDVQAINATYGNPIPILYGTARLPGTMIYQTKAEPQKAGMGKGGMMGGGGSGQPHVHQTAAFVFCEGPAKLATIWLDGKQFWSSTGLYAGKEPTKHTFQINGYLGTEDQLPDPDISLWVEINADGYFATPAFRGLCYLVFERVDLSNYGMRFPQVSAAWTKTGVDTVFFKEMIRLNPDVTTHYSVGNGPLMQLTATDWVRGVIYTLDSVDYTIRCFNIMTGACTAVKQYRQYLPNDPWDDFPGGFDTFWHSRYEPQQICCGQGGGLYVLGLVHMCGAFAIQLDPGTLEREEELPLIFGDGVTGCGIFRVVASINPQGTAEVLVGWQWLDTGLICIQVTGGLSLMVPPHTPEVMPRFAGCSYGCISVFQGKQDQTTGYTDIWVTNNSRDPGDGVTLYQYRTNGAAVWGGNSWTFTGVDFGGTTAHDYLFWSSTGWYNAADDGLILCTDYPHWPNIIKVALGTSAETYPGLPVTPGDHQVIWSVPNTFVGNAVSGQMEARALFSGTLGFASANHYTVLNTTTGGTTTINADIGDSTYSTCAYNGAMNALTIFSSSSQTRVVYLGRITTADVSIAYIITDLCGRVGVTPDMIDVSLVTQTTTGYVVHDMRSAGQAILDLCHCYQIDMVESDWVLKFIPRGQPVVATLTQADLASSDPQDASRFWDVKNAQEQEMPLLIAVKYADPDLAFQPGSAYAKRTTLPNLQTQFAKRRMNVDLPVIVNNLVARQIAERWLYTMWAERQTFRTAVSPSWLWLDPADNITVNLDNGDSYTTRIESIDTGADMTMRLSLASEDMTTYQASTITGAVLSVPTISTGGFTSLIQFNVPLLQDSDDTGGNATRIYFAADSNPDGFYGATIYKSPSGSNYTVINGIGATATFGTGIGTLGDTVAKFCTDHVNTLHVSFAAGATLPSSVAYADLMNGANAFLIGSEIVQVQTVTDNPDGTVVFSDLIRGQRGTDWATGLHVAGERVLLLEAASIAASTLSLSEINQAELWKIVPPGQALNIVIPQGFTYRGWDLMPYAPLHVSGVFSGSDVVLTWLRQTRLGGGLIDGTDTAPLGETSEAYDVEIINPADGTVKRTITGLTTPTTTYTAAQITTDWGSPPVTLMVKVYQKSSVVGRGFSHLWTLDLASGLEIVDIGDPAPVAP